MKPTEQQELILKHDGNAVVIAAPGSGKTFVLSHKIKDNFKVLKEHEGVIAISYTNKASNELKLRSLSHGENPMSSFFGTIDKFNISEIIIPFGKHLFGIPKNDIKIIRIASLPEDGQAHFNWFNRDTHLGDITNDQIDVLKKYFLRGLIMIETIGLLSSYIYSKSISCQKYIKARYKYIYIDEYQDAGFAQHQMFLEIMKLGVKAVAVGDLNQSIYAFSGKNSKYLEELTGNETFKHFKLDKNHRCHASIINYSNYLLNPTTELIATSESNVFFKRIDGYEKDIAIWIDTKIETLTKKFNITNRNQIAILTRANRSSEIINSELTSPHKLSITNELDLNLNVWSVIFSNLLHFMFDIDYRFIDVIEVFTTYDKFSKKQLEGLSKSKKILEDLKNETRYDPVIMKGEFICVAGFIAPNSENEESISLLDRVLSSKEELFSYMPAKENEINIITLHKSKGLEFDFVFHIDLYEWVLPNKIPGTDGDFNNPIYSNWTQDINLHYVGITRARKGCLLISSEKRTNNRGETKNAANSEFLSYNGIQKLRYNEK